MTNVVYILDKISLKYNRFLFLHHHEGRIFFKNMYTEIFDIVKKKKQNRFDVLILFFDLTLIRLNKMNWKDYDKKPCR